jgi:hypothetical protein
MLSSQRLARLCLTASLLSLSGCAQFQIADIGPSVTLPASGDCFRKNVLSHKETRIPKAQCDEMKKRAVFITSDDWQKQRFSIQKNCQMNKCKQLVGAFDELFLTIDSALRKIPAVNP